MNKTFWSSRGIILRWTRSSSTEHLERQLVQRRSQGCLSRDPIVGSRGRLTCLLLTYLFLFSRPASAADPSELPTRLHSLSTGEAPPPPAQLPAGDDKGAASPPGATPCDDAALAAIRKVFTTAYQADSDSFQTAYSAYSSQWQILKPACETQHRESLLLSSVDNLAPVNLAISKIAAARADLNSLRDRLRLATDEASINALSTVAKQTVSLATSAYGAVSGSENWPDYRCSSDRGLTQDAHLSVTGHDGAAPPSIATTTANSYCAAFYAFGSFTGLATVRRGAVKSMCGGFSADGNFRSMCLVYGLTSSAISYIWKLGDTPAGLGGTAVMSLLVPYGGIRFTPSEGEFGRFVAIDLTAYSAYLTTGTIQAPQPTPCIQNGNALERSLHCETNPAVHPFAALGLGLTFGEDKVGYFSLTPVSLGFAQFGAQGIHPYFGMYASVLQLSGRF